MTEPATEPARAPAEGTDSPERVSLGSASPKYIFVTGGVMSGLGKGIATASIGALLESAGLKIAITKLDPYLNVDPGTMNPFQHGEVYVTDDGAETDLDLGHYERFTHARLGRKNSITSGQIYQNVIARERRGDYLGSTVQVIPHITDEIQNRVREASAGAQVALVEVGGTVGDIESLPFFEALRQLQHALGAKNCLGVHLVPVPFLDSAGEYKTKPAQHSVNKLREIGIQPDILICRSREELGAEVYAKLALFTNVPRASVISGVDVDCIYAVPLKYRQAGLHQRIFEGLALLPPQDLDLSSWETSVQGYRAARQKKQKRVSILVVGKYVGLQESYKSLIEALEHAALAHQVSLVIDFIDAEMQTQRGRLAQVNGILVPGGFGERGIEGKIHAVRHARECGVPFLGICLGLQAAVIDFARHVAGLEQAYSGEFTQRDEPPRDAQYEVISPLKTQLPNQDLGGSMRLGAYPAQIAIDSKAYQAYGKRSISERHRHRYEVSKSLLPRLEKAGLWVTGTNTELGLVEIVELHDHPWFVGCQFHPEFKSRPGEPHPLFRDFVRAALDHRPAASQSDSTPLLDGNPPSEHPSPMA